MAMTDIDFILDTAKSLRQKASNHVINARSISVEEHMTFAHVVYAYFSDVHINLLSTDQNVRQNDPVPPLPQAVEGLTFDGYHFSMKVIDFLVNGRQMINAIKQHRTDTGWPLKEAKDAVELACKKLNIELYRS